MTTKIEDEEDIETIMWYSSCTREEAIKAIKDCNGDTMRAMDLASGGTGVFLDNDGNPIED